MCIKLQTLVLTNFEDFLNHRNIGPTCNVAFLFGQELVQEKKGLTCKFIKSFKTNYFSWLKVTICVIRIKILHKYYRKVSLRFLQVSEWPRTSTSHCKARYTRSVA